MTERIIQTQYLYRLLDLEPYILILFLVLSTWFFYKIFLRQVSEERHRNIRSQFKGILKHFIFASFLFLIFQISSQNEESLAYLSRVNPYLGIATLFSGCVVIVKSARLLVLQYLFLGSMRAGVPVLLVNIFSLILSLALLLWGVSHILGFQLAPLLATSAALSVILGLAMQETLGNLFAGISLQIDKNFEIGDWLEIVSGIQKCVGQVSEISWRSTTLVGLSDEIIVLPNRFMAMAQISNYSPDQPIIRSHIFRLPIGCNLESAKKALEMAAAEVAEVRGIPSPFAYVQETTESWVAVKLIYFLDNYGRQWNVGDRVQVRAMDLLKTEGLDLAHGILEIRQKDLEARP